MLVALILFTPVMSCSRFATVGFYAELLLIACGLSSILFVMIQLYYNSKKGRCSFYWTLSVVFLLFFLFFFDFFFYDYYFFFYN